MANRLPGFYDEPTPESKTVKRTIESIGVDFANALPKDVLDRLNQAGVDPAKFAIPKFESGTIHLMACTLPPIYNSGSDGAIAGGVDGGDRILYATIYARTGHRIFTTVGTRYTLVGFERGDNYSSLFLSHLDDPNLHHRVIIWPPDRATLTDFGDSNTGEVINDCLNAKHLAAMVSPKSAQPDKDYFSKLNTVRPLNMYSLSLSPLGPSTPPPSNVLPILPRLPWHLKDQAEIDLAKRISDPASIVLESRSDELTHLQHDRLELIGIPGQVGMNTMPVFNLHNSGWRATCTQQPTNTDPWKFGLSFDSRLAVAGRPTRSKADPANYSSSFDVRIDTSKGLARAKAWLESELHEIRERPGVDNEWSTPPKPLSFVDWHLQAFIDHGHQNAMIDALRAGPTSFIERDKDNRPKGSVAAAITIPLWGEAGKTGFEIVMRYLANQDQAAINERLKAPPPFTLELWPSLHDVPHRLLQPRLLDRHGRTKFDFRGSAWGVMLAWVWPGRPDVYLPNCGFAMHFIHHRAESQYELMGQYLVVDPFANKAYETIAPTPQGVFIPRETGCISLGQLHTNVHHCNNPSMLKQWNDDWFARSRGLPT